MNSTLLERFESRYIPEPNSGCWLWLGHLERGKFYGRFRLDGRRPTAHNASYQLHVGPIPKGMIVCHRCDNPPCVNPDHLFLGTYDDNVQDKMSKGRGRAGVGIKNGNAKLTPDQVRAIRIDPRSGSALSAEYNVSDSLIWDVKSKKLWKHIV